MTTPPDESRPRKRLTNVVLRTAWEDHASRWVEWVRSGYDDSYSRFHRRLFFDLVPAPGRRTLDLGCGDGRVSRDLTALGHRVIGIDASATMIASATEAHGEIEFQQADAAALPFSDGEFDCVVAFMSLHDFDDLPGAIRESWRVLATGGHLCLAVVHPLTSVGFFERDVAEAPLVIEGSYLDDFHYKHTVSRGGVTMTFFGAHRPIQRYTEAIADAGFVIERLREAAPPDEGVHTETERRWQRFPLFLHIRAVKYAPSPKRTD